MTTTDRRPLRPVDRWVHVCTNGEEYAMFSAPCTTCGVEPAPDRPGDGGATEPVCHCAEYWPGQGHPPDCPTRMGGEPPTEASGAAEGEVRRYRLTIDEVGDDPPQLVASAGGPWVRYDDHARELAAARREVEMANRRTGYWHNKYHEGPARARRRESRDGCTLSMNPPGEMPAVWECRPGCDADLSPDDCVIGAITGQETTEAVEGRDDAKG